MFDATFFSVYLLIFLSSSRGIRLDINIYDNSGTKTRVKLMCEQLVENPELNNNQAKFENPENQTQNILMPDIKVNSSEHYRCFLLQSNSLVDAKQLRKRVHRELTESLPAESGSCRPGYRMNQDRCFPCFPGSYTSGQETECNLCPKNFYIGTQAADSCWPCPEGKITSGEGANSEDLCVDADSSGRPRPSAVPTTWIVAIVCILIVILSVWLIFLLLWWNRNAGYSNIDATSDNLEKGYGTVPYDDSDFDTDEEDGYEEPIKLNKENTFAASSPSAEFHEYESISDKGSNDHLYEEVVRYEDIYEEPIKLNENKIPKVTSEDLYEIPTKRQEAHIYDEPPTEFGENIGRDHTYQNTRTDNKRDTTPISSNMLPSEISDYYSLPPKEYSIQNNYDLPPNPSSKQYSKNPTHSKTPAKNISVRRSSKPGTQARKSSKKLSHSNTPSKNRFNRRSSKAKAQVRKPSEKGADEKPPEKVSELVKFFASRDKGKQPAKNVFVTYTPDCEENWLSYTNNSGFQPTSRNVGKNLDPYKCDELAEMNLTSGLFSSSGLKEAGRPDFEELGFDIKKTSFTKNTSKKVKTNTPTGEIGVSNRERVLEQKSEPLKKFVKSHSTRKVRSDESGNQLIVNIQAKSNRKDKSSRQCTQRLDNNIPGQNFARQHNCLPDNVDIPEREEYSNVNKTRKK